MVANLHDAKIPGIPTLCSPLPICTRVSLWLNMSKVMLCHLQNKVIKKKVASVLLCPCLTLGKPLWSSTMEKPMGQRTEASKALPREKAFNQMIQLHLHLRWRQTHQTPIL